MLPTPGALRTVITPSATVHLAGEPSCAETHSSRFLPSKSTMASEGGAALVAPGVTTLGTGSHTSVSWGLGAGACCAERTAMRAADAKDSLIGVFILPGTLDQRTPARSP